MRFQAGLFVEFENIFNLLEPNFISKVLANGGFAVQEGLVHANIYFQKCREIRFFLSVIQNCTKALVRYTCSKMLVFHKVLKRNKQHWPISKTKNPVWETEN